MSLTRSAIEKIAELSLSAHAVETVPSEQRGVYFLREADGTLIRQRAYRDPVGATLHTTSDFARAVSLEPGAERVFVNDQGAVAVCANDWTTWALDLPLPVHPVFALVSKLDGATFDQKGVVRLLRTQLAGYVPDSVIENLRQVKTSSASESDSLTAQGNKHVDLSIRRAATLKDGGLVPESFTWSVPVFDLPELTPLVQLVTVLLDVEPAERADNTRFMLTARHDDLRRARMTVLDALVELISAHELMPSAVPVLRGQPAK